MDNKKGNGFLYNYSWRKGSRGTQTELNWERNKVLIWAWLNSTITLKDAPMILVRMRFLQNGNRTGSNSQQYSDSDKIFPSPTS